MRRRRAQIIFYKNKLLPDAHASLASAFVAMFLLTFIGFQVVHIFQPFPGEKPSEPYAGIAVFTVIFGGLLVADALYT